MSVGVPGMREVNGRGAERAPERPVLVSDVLRSRRTIQEIVADALRDAIVAGRLRGGQRLSQDRIATDLGVSRMPVREALRQLESEGLVVFTPHRRVSVADLSIDELRELYEIRIALETLALELAFPKLTAREFAGLAAILAQMDRAADAGRWITLNASFHGAMYRASARPRLCALIESYRGNVDRYLRMYVAGPERRTRAQAEHRRILRACRAGRLAEAKKALRRHLADTVTVLARVLESRGASPRPSAAGAPATDGRRRDA